MFGKPVRIGSRGAFSLALFAALALLSLAPLPARAADIVWKTRQLKWDFKVPGTVFTGGQRDTAFIQTSNDTTRTEIVDTSDWGWDAYFLQKNGASLVNVAQLTLVCAQQNAQTDTVYFTIENAQGTTVARNRTLSATLGCFMLLQGTIGGSGGPAVYKGMIQGDTSLGTAINQLWYSSGFRLCVQGDQSGTAPILEGCKLYITYPSKSFIPAPHH